MSSSHPKECTELIHHYYMNIINAVPDVVYWVDVHCNLKGCNQNFVTLMGLNTPHDFNDSPYVQMKKFAHWSDEHIEALKLDDMNVIFSGKPQQTSAEQVIVNEEGRSFHFKSKRTPMYDEQKHIIGAIVVLTPCPGNDSTAELEVPILPVLSMTCNRLPNVLMIEDNIIAQNVERALLTALNCHVDIAESGDKAVELFGPGKYDLVLMDIGLQNTSGYVVAKQLRKMEKDSTHHVPIIALTGYAADVVKYDCDDYFMEGAITKPLTSEQAEQIIKHYVYHMDVAVQGLKSI